MGWSKYPYIRLFGGHDSNSSVYSGSELDQVENADGSSQDEACKPSRGRFGIRTNPTIVFLVILGIYQSITIGYMFMKEQKHCPNSLSEQHFLFPCFTQKLTRLGGTIPMKNVARQIYVPTNFMSDNETVASAAWDAIEAGHGEVNIDPEWAADRGLPTSMRHPGDQDKMVYSIAAYHALHCLVRDDLRPFAIAG